MGLPLFEKAFASKKRMKEHFEATTTKTNRTKQPKHLKMAKVTLQLAG